MNQDIKITDINTSYPGFIYNFNPAEQIADIQIAIETAYIGLNTGYKLLPKQRLENVPVQFVRGGGWSLTFPIPDGTPCYVHFAQRGIDHWLMEGKDSAGMLNQKPAPQFNQFFAFNNAVAVVGINPINSSISNFATDGVELRNEEHDQIISLKSDGTINLITGTTTVVINKDGDITATTDTTVTVNSKNAVVNTETSTINASKSSIIKTTDSQITTKTSTIEAKESATVSTNISTVKATAATVIAGNITLDGDTLITKTLTVSGKTSLNGGVSATGGGDAAIDIKGNMSITGPINDVQIENHIHPYDWTDGAGNSNTDAPTPL